MKNRVSKLNQTELALSNGVKFTIVHDFKNMDGPVNSFDAAFQNWLSRTDEYTAESFIEYVKDKEPNRIMITLEDYLEITKDKSKPATEEDYQAENN